MKVKIMKQKYLAEVIVIENTVNQSSWTLEHFKYVLRTDHCAWVFCDTQNVIQGYAITKLLMDELHLLNICVKTQAQRQGLGRSILNHVVKYAKINSATTIILEVRISNRRAQRLYLQSGFNEMAIMDGYYPSQNSGEDAILMVMDMSILESL